MKKLLPWTLAASLSLLLLSGCGKKSDDKASMQETAPDGSSVEKYDPATDPGRNINENFLNEQAQRRDQIEKTIQAFWAEKSGDPKVVRKMILNRQGEIMSTKRNIRRSRLFTDTQKDSLVAPMDEEFMKLTRELVAFTE